MDIVNLLRALANGDHHDCSIAAKAADEIELLRLNIGRLQEVLSGIVVRIERVQNLIK